MLLWILTLFVSGFGVALHLSRLFHGTQDTTMAVVSVAVFAILGLACGYAIYRNKTIGTSQSNIDKIVDQFVKSWDRLSSRISSGRWILTIVSAAAFGLFCYVVAKTITVIAPKLPDTTLVALFMFLANILQNVFKDYFHIDRDDILVSGNGNGNGNGNGHSDDKTYAPWTDAQVVKLAARQAITKQYPCTCGTSLTPTKDGWVCCKCGFKQNWVMTADLVQPQTGQPVV